MNLDFAIRHRVEDMSYAWSDGIGKLTEGLTEKWLSGHRKEVPGIDMPYKPSDKGGNDTNGGNPRGARLVEDMRFLQQSECDEVQERHQLRVATSLQRMWWQTPILPVP